MSGATLVAVGTESFATLRRGRGSLASWRPDRLQAAIGLPCGRLVRLAATSAATAKNPCKRGHATIQQPRHDLKLKLRYR